jgi:hypothetical protein
MQLTLNKTELAGALIALGKLVCRTSPILVYRAVQIETTNNALLFRTHNMTEEIEFRMDVKTTDAIKIAVDFDFFRSLVKNCRNKNISFEFKDGKLHVDDVPIASVDGEWPVAETPQGDNVTNTPLPDNFVEILNQAAPQASVDDPRNILKGINLGKDGITATNGKELFNAPFQFNVDELTIPFPLALMATKASGEGMLTTWNNDSYVMFTVRIGQWRWTARALPGAYPNWQRVMPDSKDLKHFVSFTVERAERLRFFLKSVADTKPANEIRLYRDAVGFFTLRDGDEHEFGIPAEFDSTWGNFAIIVKKDILLHLLAKGHTRIEFSDALCPFVGSGGIGQYVAMPMRMPKTESNEQTAQVTQSVPQSQESTTPINTTTTKEKSTMIDTNTITHTVSAPVQTFTPNQESAKELNPLDELTANIEAMRTKLKAMYDESAVMSRKVREVVIAQKQKEREYVQTRKTIDRIRTASGF